MSEPMWVQVAVGYVVGRVSYDLLMYVVERFFMEKVMR